LCLACTMKGTYADFENCGVTFISPDRDLVQGVAVETPHWLVPYVGWERHANESCGAVNCIQSCVAVLPSDCSGGTMDMSELNKSSRLLVTLQMPEPPIVEVSDVERFVWTTCLSNSTHTVERSECPPNNMTIAGVFNILAALMMIMASLLYLRYRPGHRVNRAKLPNAPWGAVLVHWVCDFWVTVAASIVAQVFAGPLICGFSPLTQFLLKTGLGVAFALFYWDLGQYLIGRLFTSGRYFIVLSLYAASTCGHTAFLAYRPSSIAIVGHHPLMLGLLNFCFSFPKAIVKHRVPVWLKLSKPDPDYVMGWTEVVGPLRNFFPKAIPSETSTNADLPLLQS